MAQVESITNIELLASDGLHDSHVIFLIKGIDENFGSVSLPTVDANNVLADHNFENKRILESEFCPGATNVPVTWRHYVTPQAIVGDLNTSSEGSGSDTQTPPPQFQQTSRLSESSDALHIDASPELAPGPSTSTQDTGIGATDKLVLEMFEKYFHLSDLDNCEKQTCHAAAVPIESKPFVSKPRPKRPGKVNAATTKMRKIEVYASSLKTPSTGMDFTIGFLSKRMVVMWVRF